MKSKETYKERVSDLIEQGAKLKFSGGLFVHHDSISDCQYWFSQIISLVQEITALDTFFYDEAVGIIRGSKRTGGIAWQEIEMMKGFLRQLYDAISGDLLHKIKDEVTADDFSDFLQHARHYCDLGKKMESAVITSAIFEDTIKKVALKNGITQLSSLESAINYLKTQGVITALEAKKYKVFADIRNSALHASWDEFELKDVTDLIEGTSTIITEYLVNN